MDDPAVFDLSELLKLTNRQAFYNYQQFRGCEYFRVICHGRWL